MDSKEKKSLLLLMLVTYQYHGIDENEKQNIKEFVAKIDGEKELGWVNKFIAKNYLNSFERARKYLFEIVSDYPKEKRIEYIEKVWNDNLLKGYITEIEASAIIKLSKDWNVDEELYKLINKRLD